MNYQKNYLLVSILGFFVGLLLLPVLNNIKLPFWELNFASASAIILGCIILFNFAIWLAFLICERIQVFPQLVKFGAVGSLNTLLDLGILNLLIYFSSIAAGYWYSLFKAISFIAANINSYFWNKHWTFGSRNTANIREFSQFLIVSLIGFGINVSIASFVVNGIGPLKNISPERWANIGALLATIISLIWNFIGYKFFVFKKSLTNSKTLAN